MLCMAATSAPPMSCAIGIGFPVGDDKRAIDLPVNPTQGFPIRSDRLHRFLPASRPAA